MCGRTFQVGSVGRDISLKYFSPSGGKNDSLKKKKEKKILKI